MQSTNPGAAPKGLTRRRAETRQRLIEAAYEVFAEHGIRDAPVELICERAGYTRGAFYSNFTSKEEIFLAMYEIQMSARATRLTAGTESALQAVSTSDPDRAAKVVALIAAQFVDGLDDDVRWYPVFAEFRAQALRRPDLCAPTAAAEARFGTALAAALHHGQGLARRLLARGDPEKVHGRRRAPLGEVGRGQLAPPGLERWLGHPTTDPAPAPTRPAPGR